MSTQDTTAAAEAERVAEALFRSFVRENADALRLIAHWGDGAGGYLAKIVCDEVGVRVLAVPPEKYRKAHIPRSLAKRVFERDAYRCKHCGGHHDLCVDHVIPESKGGETTFANLQTLCRPCNSKKGARDE